MCGRRCTQHEFVLLSATTPMDPVLSESLEATAMKNVLAQCGEWERDRREAAILTLLVSMGLRLGECCRLNLGDEMCDRYVDRKNP